MMLILILGFYFEVPEDPLFHWYIRKASDRKKNRYNNFLTVALTMSIMYKKFQAHFVAK